jgi:hypothetical protein
VRALRFQGIAGLGCDVPPGATASHEVQAMPCVPPPGGDPAAGLAFVLAPLPVRATMAPHLRVRLLEGDLMEQAQPLPQPCGAVGPCTQGTRPACSAA